ncbi:MFS transporter [Janibacter cremeus]|uniref:EmrB/QacA subfamily drug resistance transporter n=1 Tax=Janibacter cremeus TaxID=1285192 RepID=A0A852VR01_9MICO|nr:MFS transporter [Janibacter cremeus]NYF98646.1 EmrB/QacA subfamily drug resistance transporter [Janibacter cremeus]
MPEPVALLERTSRRGLLTLTAVTLGSGVALLDATIVGIALPTIGRDLDASLSGLQWINNGYVLTLAALILVGGGLGDRWGRRRMYLVGMLWFALASLGCALAQSTEWLVAARMLQGVGAALLTPGGLAIIQSSFQPKDRPWAIGTWAGVSGIATAIGPFMGGWILDHLTWHWIFAVNVPLCALVIGLALVAVPESRDVESVGSFDLAGAGTTVVALGALTWLLTSGPTAKGASLAVAGAALVLAVAGFVLAETRVGRPLVPFPLFTSRVFAAANLMTFLVYGALGAIMFVLVIQLQTSSGWSPLTSGLATLPVTVLLLLLSPRMAELADRTGPRLPMSVGPVVCAVGVLVLSGVGPGTGWVLVLSGTSVFALGLTALVSPLTAAVLAAAPDRLAGSASGINNAVARTGTLLAVAAIPPLVGLTGDDYTDPTALTQGYRLATFVVAGLLLLGGGVSWLGLRPPSSRTA